MHVQNSYILLKIKSYSVMTDDVTNNNSTTLLCEPEISNYRNDNNRIICTCRLKSSSCLGRSWDRQKIWQD